MPGGRIGEQALRQHICKDQGRNSLPLDLIVRNVGKPRCHICTTSINLYRGKPWCYKPQHRRQHCNKSWDGGQALAAVAAQLCKNTAGRWDSHISLQNSSFLLLLCAMREAPLTRDCQVHSVSDFLCCVGGDTAPWYELGRGVSGNPFQQFMPLDSYLSGDAAGAMPEGGQEAEQLAASQPAEAAQSQEAAPAEKGASSGRHVAAAVSAVEAGGARGPPAAQQAEHEPAIGSRLPTPQPGAPQAPAAEAGPTEVAALQAAAAARSSLPETGRLQAAPQASQGAGGPPPASAFGEDSAFEASSSFEAPTSGADRQTLPEISFDGAENAFGAGSFPAEATSSRAGGQPLPPSTFGGEESAFGASSFPAEAASSRAAAAPGPPPGEAPGSGPSSGAWEPAAPQVPQGLGSDAFEAEWPSELGVGQQRVASPYTFSQPTLAAAGAGPAAGQAHAGPAAQPCSAEAVHPEASQPEASGAALTQPGGPPQQQQQQKGLGSPVASASGVDVSRAFAPGSTNSVRQLSEMFKAEQQQPPRQAAAGRGLGRGRGRGHSFSEVDLWLPMDPEERRQMEDAFEAKVGKPTSLPGPLPGPKCGIRGQGVAPSVLCDAPAGAASVKGRCRGQDWLLTCLPVTAEVQEVQNADGGQPWGVMLCRPPARQP